MFFLWFHLRTNENFQLYRLTTKKLHVLKSTLSASRLVRQYQRSLVGHHGNNEEVDLLNVFIYFFSASVRKTDNKTTKKSIVGSYTYRRHETLVTVYSTKVQSLCTYLSVIFVISWVPRVLKEASRWDQWAGDARMDGRKEGGGTWREGGRDAAAYYWGLCYRPSH